MANGTLATLDPDLNEIAARVKNKNGEYNGTRGDTGTQRSNLEPLEKGMEC